jgi:peptidoglycan/LPS O-acetylase OafA/YrhL
VVARRGRREAAEGAVLLFTLAYAVPYLLTGVMERYRIPMASAVALALALLTWTLIESWGRRGTSPDQST